ncbi:MAG: transcription termination/antitermination protein NusA [Clostridia bacterium]|nr:transcription termination/antitermination protein NusA [Clostridia bacterium]
MYKSFFDEVDRHLKEKVVRIKKLNDPVLKQKLGTDTAKMTALLAQELYGKLERELASFAQKLIGTDAPITCCINYTAKNQTVKFYIEKTVVVAKNGLVTNPAEEIALADAQAYKKSIKAGDSVQSEISISKFTKLDFDGIALHAFRKLVYEEEFFNIIEAYHAESTKGYSEDAQFTVADMCSKFETAIATAVANEVSPHKKEAVHCDIDAENKTVRLYVVKDVVGGPEDVCDPDIEISVEDAQSYKNGAVLDDLVECDLDITAFGRVVAQTVKHVFRQGVSDLTKDMILRELQAKEKELITAKFDSYKRNDTAILKIGNLEVYLPKNEQIANETFKSEQMVQAYLVEVSASAGKEPKVKISRTHHGFVKRLFEKEVTEILEGTVEIKSIAREAGSRTKIAVWSKDEDIDPVGACIGPKGARVNAIIKQLGGEKIDVIKYSDDPVEYITAALAPAEIINVRIISDGADGADNETKSCQVTVPDTQLSLAIGNKGQNARLAAKLTGWKIDIKPESGFYQPMIQL